MASVLIVEDERSLRETLARIQTQEGHDVISAANGREAFDQGITAKPDVLVTDWMLKNHIHGLHVAEALKAVHSAVTTERRPAGASPLAVVELDLEGKLHFVSERARELFAQTAGGADASQLQDVLGGEIISQLKLALDDWVGCATLPSGDGDRGDEPERWLLRARMLNDRASPAGRLRSGPLPDEFRDPSAPIVPTVQCSRPGRPD